MQVQEVMSQAPKVISPESSLVEAAKLMREGDFGFLPVCNGERLIGMITDRDIAIRAMADGCDLNDCQVQDVMSTDVYTCRHDSEIAEAGELMSTKQVRRLPVINEQKRLVGIISLGDLAREPRQTENVGQALQSISQPTVVM